MATTQVQICNLALGMIGAARITSLADNSVEARSCNAIYELLRNEVLESFPWSFARGRSALAREVTVPAFGYAYQYALPTDFLSPLPDYDELPAGKYAIEGRSLLTDLDSVNLRYIKSISDPTFFSASFVSCLSLRMAIDLAMSIAKDKQMSLKLFQMYQVKAREYKFENAKYDVIDGSIDSTYYDARS